MYSPQEDSYFISKILEKIIVEKDKLNILDMGTGTGFQAQTCIKLGSDKKNILCVDINKKAVEHCEKLGFKSLQSNLFENIPKNKEFDLIIFNPPYLPRDKYDCEKDTSGGKNGSEIINKFLKQARIHLNKKGKIILLTSSFTKGIKFKEYKKKLLGEKKLFFEELYVWELR